MTQQLTQNVILLSVAQFSVTDDETKKVNEGCTVRYLMSDNLEHTEDTTKPIKGLRPAKVTLPLDEYHKFQTVPAIYEAVLGFSVDAQGNTKLTPTDFKFVCGITVNKSTGGKLNLGAKEAAQ